MPTFEQNGSDHSPLLSAPTTTKFSMFIAARVRWGLYWRAVSFLVGLATSHATLGQQPATPAAVAKLAPQLRATSAVSALRVRVTDMAAFRAWLYRELPAAKVLAEPHHSGLLQVRGAAPAALARCPWVAYVDVAARTAREERQLNGADFTLNTVAPVHARYPQLAGQGLTASVKENPLDINDIDFKGRLVNPDPQAVLLSSHSTIMATIMAGAGNSSPNGKGVAWQARIAQSSYDNLLPDDGTLLARQGVSVQNHSYGVAIENYYGLEARAYDQQTRQYPGLLHVFSSGNSGNQASTAGPYMGLANVANLTGQFKMSKNTLSVGATDAVGNVAALSSRGPAYDGRVKPELVAYGDGGSSEAAALVSGVGLLVQQAYRNQHNALPPAALVKAVLLNSADDTGRPAVDFVSGYGQVDALGAVQTVVDGRYRQGTVAQGQEQLISLTVPSGTHRVKVTLTWSDLEATENAAQALVNDLDITLVQAATGQRWLPWVLSAYPHLDSLALPARRRPDHLNNTEQITIETPTPGLYQLRVRGYQVQQAPQPFSVAYEFEQGFQWTHPTQARNLRVAEATRLRWHWRGPAAAGRLEYKAVGQTTWKTIAASVDVAAQNYLWTAPDTTAPMQVRMRTGIGSIESDTFFVARPLTLEVAYACTDETLLNWRRVPGATHYQVYALGATHLEPFRLLTDTAILLTASEARARYFAVAPIIRGKVGERGSSPNVTDATYGCYIRSFLSRQVVADTVQFQLVLGTTYRVKTVALERRDSEGVFRTVQTAAPALSLVLTDPHPVVGRAEYRARVDVDVPRTLYSSVEEAFFVPRNEVLVYPVPVVAGEPLTLVGPKDQPLRVRVYDVLGRLRSEVSTEGTVNSVVLPALGKGTFLLRISAGGGAEITRRILVL